MSQSPPPDLTAPQQEAGWSFRAEMLATNVLLGYWKYILGAIAAVLFALFAYGQYTSWHLSQMRGAAAEISDVRGDLRDSLANALDPQVRDLLRGADWNLQFAMYRFSRLQPDDQQKLATDSESMMRVLGALGSMDETTRDGVYESSDGLDTVILFLGTISDADKPTVEQSADKLADIANRYGGSEGAMALVDAADLYARVGDADKERTALQAASAMATPVEKYAAETRLAELDVEAGNVDAGLQRYRTLMNTLDGYLAQDAALELGRALEAAGKKDDALKVYGDFATKWPTSPLIDEVNHRKDRLTSGEGAAPAPPPASGGEQGAAPSDGTPTGVPSDEAPAPADGTAPTDGTAPAGGQP